MIWDILQVYENGNLKNDDGGNLIKESENGKKSVFLVQT
jgi:hypothetical protein